MLLPNYSGMTPEAGTDEAGRGCLAGPVVAAAVILPPDFNLPGLDDSKKLSPSKRNELRKLIEEQAESWCVATVSAEEIDKINILNASILAMHRALDGLSTTPTHIIADGNKFKPYRDIPYTTIVKGDGEYSSIAAASVLAKTHRDEIMNRLAHIHPGYGWAENMGYPTKFHLEALEKLGLSPQHRRTYAPCRNILNRLDLF